MKTWLILALGAVLSGCRTMSASGSSAYPSDPYSGAAGGGDESGAQGGESGASPAIRTCTDDDIDLCHYGGVDQADCERMNKCLVR